MLPTSSRDFQRAAAQRLNAAEILWRQGVTLDSQYLGGYTVECSLKALILRVTLRRDREATLNKITSGSKMHRPEVLLGELRDRGVELPREIARRMRRFDWTTNLRYEVGRRDSGETWGLLKTAKAIYDWVEGKLS